MKIVALPDVHLGFRSGSRVVDGINLRENDVYHAFDNMIDMAVKESPDVVVVVGDLFDSTRPPAAAYCVALKGLRKIQCPVIVISGNHDKPLRDAWSPLSVLSVLPHVKCVVDSPSTIYVEGASFYCIPYTTTPKFEEADFLVAHLEDKSVSQFRNRGIEIPYEKYTYCFLGHLHMYTKLSENACYIGAVERFSFNQEGFPCGYLVYDKGGIRFVETPARPYITLTSPPQTLDSLQGAIVRCRTSGADVSWVEELRRSGVPLQVTVELSTQEPTNVPELTVVKPLLESFDEFCEMRGIPRKLRSLCVDVLKQNME
ncbi:hypothetical protein DRO41_00525 [Candidatus Bathyarchaeota archaeon]|nr:MAG: hypothetical protein DRO41_00525 [Candidatus Bathyarchaeota archaeon]